MIKINTDIRFDFAGIQKSARRTMRRGLFRWAGFVRTTARRSFGRSKKPAAAGAPPNSHDGRLKRSILFAVDSTRDEARVGPTAAKKYGSTTGAEVVEYGGTISRDGQRWTYGGNPYMRPAAEKGNARLASFFS